MRNLRFTYVLATLMFTMAAAGQNISSADLHGTITDPNGAVLSGATVSVEEEGKSTERTTRTDARGEYFFSALPPGQYVLTVSAASFAKLTAKDVKLTVGQRAELPIALKPATAAQEITVNGEAEMVETQRSSASTTVTQERIDNLPINGRNYINFTLTNSQTARDVAPSIGAAPTSGLNIGGQRARSNLVNVDGADAGDNSVNGIRSTVSQEAVQEFQILTNGYAAEYGRASGGVVNIVTRGGGNQMHGNVYGYLRNRRIQAQNPFTNVQIPAYTRVQAGFTLSGPIVKQRTFYYLSYEDSRRQETGFSTIGTNNFDLVPIDISRFDPAFGLPAGTPNSIFGTAQQAAFLAVVPVSAGSAKYAALVGRSSGAALNGRWPTLLGGAAAFGSTGLPLPPSYVALNSLRGNYPVSEGTSLWGLRLDHKLNAGNSLMLRGNVSPSTVTGIQVNAQNQNFGQNSWSRTSQQTYRDLTLLAQETALFGQNKINEFRFQFARRGLRYDFSRAPGGGNVAINIPGFAFFGREPFSFVDRTEKRTQVTDNFSLNHGNHAFKFGGDFNYLPVRAQFTVNFGGLFNFGEVTPIAGLPKFNAVQAYGLGAPQVFVQGIGNPNAQFVNTTFGTFAQDTWRITKGLTLNYGIRYDVELTPRFNAVNALSTAAEKAMRITEGIPRDFNNIAPRIGLAWDPWKDGKTAIRASYGLFYDHPLLALAFNSQVADGSQAPQVALFGGSPCPAAGGSASPLNLNAANIFQGSLGNANCGGAALAGALGFLPQEQRFQANTTTSAFVNQNYLTAGIPLTIQPFGFPVASNFQYAYSEQANLQVERELAKDLTLTLGYNFNGGHHLNRPINVNPVNSEALVANWEKAVAAGAIAPTALPLSVASCGVGPLGAFYPAALVSFFRPSGLNPSLPAAAFPGCASGAGAAALAAYLSTANKFGVPIPFSDQIANFSNGSSVYHGLTTNLKKRFTDHYEFLASYTWSKTIDDSTDLQSLLSPQDNRKPALERSLSTFDQRHRFVLSGVYQSGRMSGDNVASKVFSGWTVAPIIELSSGRPFNILVGSDRNFDLGSNTDRPLVARSGQANLCGDTAVASDYSPTGFLIPSCYVDGVFDGVASAPLIGNLSRNAGRRPYTVFTDLRLARTLDLTERVKLQGIVDIFNLINRFNVADVNFLYTQNGRPTAAFDPRQFQFGLRLSF